MRAQDGNTLDMLPCVSTPLVSTMPGFAEIEVAAGSIFMLFQLRFVSDTMFLEHAMISRHQEKTCFVSFATFCSYFMLQEVAFINQLKKGF